MSDPVVLGIDIAKLKFDAALFIGGTLKHNFLFYCFGCS
jgi:hypothetical protein